MRAFNEQRRDLLSLDTVHWISSFPLLHWLPCLRFRAQIRYTLLTICCFQVHDLAEMNLPDCWALSFLSGMKGELWKVEGLLLIQTWVSEEADITAYYLIHTCGLMTQDKSMCHPACYEKFITWLHWTLLVMSFMTSIEKHSVSDLVTDCESWAPFLMPI